MRIALEMLDAAQGQGRLLDIGCAAGAEFPPLLARGFQIVGIDYSPEILRLAEQRLGALHGVRLCRGDAEALPFPDASFDRVVCLGVFEYLATYDRCLEEIRRVLRSGGVAIISLPTRISLNRFSTSLLNMTVIPLGRAIAMKRLAGRRTSGQRAGRRWNRCLPWQIPALLRKHGFNPERHAYSGFLLFLWGRSGQPRSSAFFGLWRGSQNRAFWDGRCASIWLVPGRQRQANFWDGDEANPVSTRRGARRSFIPSTWAQGCNLLHTQPTGWGILR